MVTEMKKRVISISLALLIFLSLLPISAFAEDMIIQSTLTLNVGQEGKVMMRDPRTNDVLSLKWSSTDSSVATVKPDGTVKGVNAGKCYAKAKLHDALYGFVIIVKGSAVSSKAATAVICSLNKKSAKLTVGKKLKLKLKNAKASKVKWSSSKKSVASVSKKGVVKAKKKGKATITAKYNGKSYKCKITVKAKKKSAFTRLKQYFKKNGEEKITESAGRYFFLDEKPYTINYDVAGECFNFNCEYKKGSSSGGLMMSLKKNGYVSFDYTEYTPNKRGVCSLYMLRKSVTKDGLNFKADEENDLDKTKLIENARAMVMDCLPKWDKIIKRRAGISMKELGFTKW